MELLLEQCANLTIENDRKHIDWYNNTIWELHARTTVDGEDHVNTNSFIGNGNYIGELEGERKYAWEVLPAPYIVWVTDEWVIDCTEKPRCILAMVRESHYDGLEANCEWFKYVLDGELKFGLFAKKDIQPHEELIGRYQVSYY